MNPELKAKWLRALRSGDYSQCRKDLRDADSFCCLGVLCDVSGLGGWNGADQYVIGEDARSGYPHGAVREAADVDGGMVRRLARMNDDGASFAEIADVIEREL